MKTQQILITGDISIDKNIYVGQRKSPEDKGYGTLINERKGGSHLLFKLISEAVNNKIPFIDKVIADLEVQKNKLKDKPKEIGKLEIQKNLLLKEKSEWEKPQCVFGLQEDIASVGNIPECITTFSTWGIKKYIVPKEFGKVFGKETECWKMVEPLGYGNELKSPEAPFPGRFYSNHKAETEGNPDMLVIDDGGKNFRNDEEAWMALLYEKSAGAEGVKRKNIDQIILKTAYPLGHGRLFRELTSEFKDNLTIITSIDEIRKEDVLISKGVSWEQTALDLIYELRNNRAINSLLKCKHLIVNLQSEGALYLEMQNEEIWKCRLIFDPEHLEGDWSKAGKVEGSVIGLMTCFTAAIVFGFLDKEFNIEIAINRALSAMRNYKIAGHTSDIHKPGFPFENICMELVSVNSRFASAFVPIPEVKKTGEGVTEGKNGCGNLIKSLSFQNQNWTILEGNYKACMNSNPDPLYDTAFRLALNGNNELVNTPFLKIKNFMTYDRREIEALKNIKNLIDQYLESKKEEKPLSLAVFGTPGSGKSFAVKQLAKSLELPFLEFNLSQFADVRELIGAFHQVRDKVLEGKTPIVFWDEFDSQSYLWLQYLLAPMQDGKFQEGQIIHPVGKCIFIFAGATCYTYQTFGVSEPNYPDPADPEFDRMILEYQHGQEKYKDFILKKGPDFKSRLSGYLNVQGPNQVECLDEKGKVKKDPDGNTIYNTDDIIYPVRRALFIRNIAGIKDDAPLNIDYGLLNAMIRTRKYLHGSRSLEKLISHLITTNNCKLQRSNLPSSNVLTMLVDHDFTGLLEKDNTFDFQAFNIAPQIHQNWIRIGDSQGWKLEYHKDYNYLPTHLKDENIASARRIPKILSVLKPGINLEIVPKSESEFYKEADFSTIIATGDNLERFAIEEHKGWAETKVKSGWYYHETRNDDRKQHNCLLEWVSDKQSLLPVKEQKKDKDAIQNFQKVLDAAGFAIIEKKS